MWFGTEEVAPGIVYGLAHAYPKHALHGATVTVRRRWVPPLRLCLVRYPRMLTVEALISYDRETIESHTGPHLKLLLDLRAVDMDSLGIGDAGTWGTWARSMSIGSSHPSLRTATLVSGPRGTAIAMLLREFSANAMNMEIFNSAAMAYRYLMVESTTAELHQDIIPA